MKKISNVFFLALVLFLVQSCTKDPLVESQNGTAPTLPPQETFLMPFTGFDNADTTDLTQGGSNSRNFNTHWHWFYSVTNVVVWNAVLTVNMVIPVASFAEAFNHEPVLQGNGIWLWAYNYTTAGQTYLAELTGQFVSNDEVQWDMYIEQVGGFSKVHWFSGVIATDGSKGRWTLNHRPNNPSPYLAIEYSEDKNSGIGSLRYTNIDVSSSDKGDYIEYREYDGPEVQYNRAYDVYRANKDNLLEIQWNEETENGRVKDPDHFNNEDWYCWDENFIDVDC